MAESVRCALCGDDDAELLFVGHDRLHGAPGEFNVVRCRACSLVYLDPRPTWDEMRKFYPEDYAPHSFKRTFSPLQRLIRRGGFRRKRQLVQRRKLGGALLDVGCATGGFLQTMSQDGNWRLFGVEPDAEAACRAAEIKGAQVFHGRWEDAEYPPGSFDVVTMWHVFEHLYDPKDALSRLRRMLKPDGVLILGVPVLDSFDAKWFGPYWSGYDVPRHLFVYSFATLSAMLSSAGFSSVRFDRFIGGYDAFRISLNFWAQEHARARYMAKLLQAGFPSLAFRLLMLPYFAVVNRLGRGSTVVATASPL